MTSANTTAYILDEVRFNAYKMMSEMNFSVDPQSFTRALEFLLWWQWIAIAAWGWSLIWLLESHPWGLGAFASHPVITGIALFGTFWGFFTFINYRFHRWQSRRADRRHGGLQ
jgi:hypothetical protein